MFIELPVSGLHRLFHTTAAGPFAQPSKSQSSLASVTEDAHTYDLLYPDLSTLRQIQNHAYPLKDGDPSQAALAATSHDDRGGLDIQSPRDVRIIIAQDGNVLAQQPRILYDSHPAPSGSAHHQGDSHGAADARDQHGAPLGPGTQRHHTGAPEAKPVSRSTHARGASLGGNVKPQSLNPITPHSPDTTYRGAFSHANLRRSGGRPASSGGESRQSKAIREKREETEALLGCMFGSTGLPMVSSTKLHVKPAGSNEVSALSHRVGAGEHGSARIFAKRCTPLTRSTTADEFQGLPPPCPEDDNQLRTRANNASVLLTRIFSVDIADSLTPKHAGELGTGRAGPARSSASPESVGKATSLAESEKAKQVKTPAYAVGIVLQLPCDRHRTPAPLMPGGSSFQVHRFSQSPKAMGELAWEEPSPVDLAAQNTDEVIENLLERWNMLDRVVSALEALGRSKIKSLLVDLEAQDKHLPLPRCADASDALKSKQKRLKAPSQRTIQLPAGALQQSETLADEIHRAGDRVAAALRIRPVISGQGRWGVWREEARWVGKWAGGREQNFFFFNLLTAFLGTHTEWLGLLGHSWYRRRPARLVHPPRKDVSVIPHRTVVVSVDKMAARRLIFLLSAFLPNPNLPSAQEDANRPQSPWSMAACSQSPPSGISVLRQQSLRRTINRRARGNRAGVHKLHERAVSFSDQGSSADPGVHPLGDRNGPRHVRRTSDARSITSLPLPISNAGGLTRKSSTTTTATVIPDAAIPVPHFSNNLSPDLLMGTSAEARPGSSGSFASLSLKHTLTRSESTDRSNSADSHSTSRWGSMISSFWSTRRGSSTDGSEGLPSHEGLGISGIGRERRQSRPCGILAQMVEEIDQQPEHRPLARENARFSHGIIGPTSVPPSSGISRPPGDHGTQARNIPNRPKIEQFPMKLSIDEQDGVVDVDLPMPSSFSSSFASSMSSPKASHTGASSFNDSAMHHRALAPNPSRAECTSSHDVAGWLKTYHPDFALQAVRPYEGLERDIQRSMRAEAGHAGDRVTLHPAESTTGPWTEVCTTLIANAQTFSIRRLSLRRRRVPHRSHPHDPGSVAMEEEIVEEPVMDLDATLIDAVERVLAQSCQSSRVHSRTASPSRHPALDSPSLEVPRSECRKLVLGALEQVAKSVREEQERRGRGIGGREPREAGMLDSTLREGVRKWLNEAGGE
jgi:hypothetical protein